MLQFWKKDRQRSPQTSPNKLKNNCNLHNQIDQELSVYVGPLSRFKCEILSKQLCEAKSRLALNIEDVFHNKIALSYFSQFMEARGHVNIFNLLMDLENVPFKLDTPTLKKTGSLVGTPCKTHQSGNSDISDTAINDYSFMCTTKIYNQYLCDDATHKVRIPEELKLSIQIALNAMETSNCLAQLKDYTFHLIRREIWLDFLKSDWHCKYQIEVMTSGTMTLSDVLYYDPSYTAFFEFLEQEDYVNIIEFWSAATNFEKHYILKKDTADYSQIQNDAILIYDKYLSLQATYPLGISDKVRFEVEEGICGETETSPDCLRPAVILAETFLESNCLRPFLSSQQYLSLLSYVMSSSSRPNHSPASSVTEGSIDTRSVGDPDGLWRRRKHI
uniref:RGS domain-containing protein n=2 Tax=Rhodnius prolixus TaxID=13249 RepID=T1HRK5_RHOPR